MREYFNGQPMDTGSVGEIYSTEEVQIGTWLGKPLYRVIVEKTIQNTVGESKPVFTKNNTFDIKSVYGIYKNTYGHVYSIPTSTQSSGLVITWTYGDIGINVTSYRSDFLEGIVIFIIEYTKTTDNSTLDLQLGTKIDVLLPDITSEASSAKPIKVQK